MRTAWDRARRRSPRGDQGFGLAELLVSMVVSGVVLAATAVMFNTALRSNTSTEARLDGINQARVAASAMSRTLRTAVLPSQLDDVLNTDAAFLQGEPNSVFFYANVNNPNNAIGPSRVSYTVTAGRLIQTIQPPLAHAAADHNYLYCDLALVSCARNVTLLAENVLTSTPLFTYFSDLGTTALSSVCGGLPCLSGAELAAVDTVEIRVVVGPRPGQRTGPSTFITRVALPNHDAVVREEAQP